MFTYISGCCCFVQHGYSWEAKFRSNQIDVDKQERQKLINKLKKMPKGNADWFCKKCQRGQARTPKTNQQIAAKIGYAGVVRCQAVDISPLRRVNQAIYFLTSGARESTFRNVKTIAECVADELINAPKCSSNSVSGRLTNAQTGTKIRKKRERKTLGEDVGILVAGRNVKDANVAASNFVANEMDVEFDVFRMLVLNRVGGHVDGAHVITIYNGGRTKRDMKFPKKISEP